MSPFSMLKSSEICFHHFVLNECCLHLDPYALVYLCIFTHQLKNFYLSHSQLFHVCYASLLNIKKFVIFVCCDRFNWSPHLHGLCFEKIFQDHQNILECFKQLRIYSGKKVCRYEGHFVFRFVCLFSLLFYWL